MMLFKKVIFIFIFNNITKSLTKANLPGSGNNYFLIYYLNFFCFLFNCPDGWSAGESCGTIRSNHNSILA